MQRIKKHACRKHPANQRASRVDAYRSFIREITEDPTDNASLADVCAPAMKQFDAVMRQLFGTRWLLP